MGTASLREMLACPGPACLKDGCRPRPVRLTAWTLGNVVKQGQRQRLLSPTPRVGAKRRALWELSLGELAADS